MLDNLRESLWRPSGQPMSWRRIPQADLPSWNQRLWSTDAPLFQYPFWAEAFRWMHFSPRYLTYQDGGSERAFVSILSIGVPGFRIGLVLRGPVDLGGAAVSSEALAALAAWACRHGFVFLRFSHSSAEALERVAALPGARRENPFPFYCDQDEELIVEQRPGDGEMLRTFQQIARQEIRKAEKVGYEIRAGDTEELFVAAWPLFSALAERKGMSYRPLQSYLELLRQARPLQAARLYVAYLKGRPVEAVLIVRDRHVALYVSGALDVKALGEAQSPSCLVHWQAMRDFYQLGQTYYNLGSSSGVVYQFKRKFRPQVIKLPKDVTVVTNPLLFSMWKTLVLRLALPAWPWIKRLVAR
jgi:Acetyltransferase (GNAT) domain